MENPDIASALAEQGYCIVPGFYRDTAALRDALRTAWQSGALHRAGVGQGAARQVRDDIRGDYVQWLAPDSPDPAVRHYFETMESLRQAINQRLYLGLFDYEAHFALYPPGAGYQKHLDGFAGDKRRKVSCVLYLNEDWHPEDGGALRIYRDDGDIDTLPQAGTLACFLADDCWHAVLPAARERMSVTGWFKIR